MDESFTDDLASGSGLGDCHWMLQFNPELGVPVRLDLLAALHLTRLLSMHRAKIKTIYLTMACDLIPLPRVEFVKKALQKLSAICIFSRHRQPSRYTVRA
ncbi:hypothetical protein [Methylocaldum sp.]|uniref:hypothetical protein n=1 Tax=Methylocaldum sp. TaxID=1969727 RepID=UPI002D372843|nr:hypothetical protein [Methylocaldum sp.]HYE37350.1 hypothetical protein [Methylocaldum sp.]